mgnify:CR=1 FL=1
MKKRMIILMLTIFILQTLPSFATAIIVPSTTNFLSVQALGALLSKLDVAKVNGKETNDSLISLIALGILNKADFINECNFGDGSIVVNCFFTITFQDPTGGELRNQVVKLKYSVHANTNVLFPEVIHIK